MIQSLKASHLKPKFLYDETGNLFLQITVGSDKLVRPIPSMDTLEEAEKYINTLAFDMAKELYKTRRNRLKRARKPRA